MKQSKVGWHVCVDPITLCSYLHFLSRLSVKLSIIETVHSYSSALWIFTLCHSLTGTNGTSSTSRKEIIKPQSQQLISVLSHWLKSGQPPRALRWCLPSSRETWSEVRREGDGILCFSSSRPLSLPSPSVTGNIVVQWPATAEGHAAHGPSETVILCVCLCVRDCESGTSSAYHRCWKKRRGESAQTVSTFLDTPSCFGKRSTSSKDASV